MWWAVLLISLIFILTPFIVNKSNAKYLLAGYNTMPEEDRSKFDLDNYLKYLRRFFAILGVGSFISYLILWQLLNEEAGFIFYILLIIISLPVMLLKSKTFYDESIRKKYGKINNWASGFMLLVLAGLIVLFYLGLQPCKLELGEDAVHFRGMYGQKIRYLNIEDIAIEEQLPEISFRTNGFALGKHLKGNFRTVKGRNILLFVRADHPPFLKIEASGKIIYWNSKEADLNKIYASIAEQVD